MIRVKRFVHFWDFLANEVRWPAGPNDYGLHSESLTKAREWDFMYVPTSEWNQ